MTEINYGNYHPTKRHYLYGSSSYPVALGERTPILQRDKESSFISYYKPFPGSLSNAKNIAETLQSDDLVEVVLKGCEEDGLIPMGMDFEIKPEFNTLALFFNKDKDQFSFAKFVDDEWWIKVPMLPDMVFEGVGPLRRYFNYELHSFLLAPEDATSKSISELELKDLKVRSDDGNETTLKEIVPSTGPEPFFSSGLYKIDTKRRTLTECDVTDLHELNSLPMPAWNIPGETKSSRPARKPNYSSSFDSATYG